MKTTDKCNGFDFSLWRRFALYSPCATAVRSVDKAIEHANSAADAASAAVAREDWLSNFPLAPNVAAVRSVNAAMESL